MTFPSFLFGLIIAILIAMIFHAFRGGSGWRLLMYTGFSIVGFFLAQWVGGIFAWGLYPFGVLDAGLGVVGSVLFILLAGWLIPA